MIAPKLNDYAKRVTNLKKARRQVEDEIKEAWERAKEDWKKARAVAEKAHKAKAEVDVLTK